VYSSFSGFFSRSRHLGFFKEHPGSRAVAHLLPFFERHLIVRRVSV
jgi:hypothetical protein